jgi:ribose transport system substrate-binding protein
MIEEQTDATIVATQEANEPAAGLQKTETVLQGHPNITVVVGTNDDAALGAAEAFRKAGSKKPSEVFIIGEDGSEEGLKDLLNPQSFFRATAALDLTKLAQESVNVAARALEKGWKPGDKQEYAEIPQTLIENGDTKLIKQFLAAYGN